MKPSKAKCLRRILPVLRRHGIDWLDLVSRSEQIVLFGSTVLGESSENSDVDILCIGEGKRVKTRALDLMWRPPERMSTSSWLGSELAGHIAAYGVWLHGKGEWAREVYPSKASIGYKRKLISARACCLLSDWEAIREEYRQKHVVKLRRDLQRLLLLQKGRPVPPTPVLDALWAKRGGRATTARLVRATGTQRTVTARHLRRFAPYLQRRSESSPGRKRSPPGY